MLRTLRYMPATQSMETGGEELISRWEDDTESVLWLDLTGLDVTEEGDLLRSRFGIHPMAVQDAQRARHPPKLEAFENTTFMLLKAPHPSAHGVEFATIQLALFINPRLIITRHYVESPAVNQCWEEAKGGSTLLARGPGLIALRLSRIMIDHYLKNIMSIEARIEELEVKMQEIADDTMLMELTDYKGNLKKLRRVFVYHLQLFSDLRSGSFPGFNEELVHEIVDVYEQQERANSLTLLYYELASDLVDGYISLASHRLNQIVKVLTIITVIFVPLGLLAGIYGMNFENMPELHSPTGYYSVLGIMAFIALTLLLVFRKKKWI